jgi:signal transduction histidine kinase
MIRSLYSKLVLVLLGLVVFVGAIGIVFALYTERLYEKEANQRLNRDLAANLVAGDVLLVDGEVNEEGLEHVFHSLMVVNPNIEVYLLTLEGEIVAYSAPKGRVKRDRVSVEPIEAYLAGAPLPIEGDDPRSLDRQKVFSVSPIMVEDRYEGYLYVVLSSEIHDTALDSVRSSHVMRLGLGVLGASLTVALVAGIVLFNLMTRPLRRLSRSMKAFHESDFTTPLPPDLRSVHTGADEIGQLCRTFHQMEERILQQVQKLRQTDQLRRELIANVSHDLRTPLASMQGYLETMALKAETLNHQEREQYLAIASKHTARLRQLVEELFELARLESEGMHAEVEPFPIAELVQDVVQDFKLRAQETGVELTAALPRTAPLVSADIGLIQRALQNLIANAVRHTDAGGQVTIVVSPEGNAVVVRVEDTGSGIPEPDLQHVFERFYQAEIPDRPGARRTGGLGLAIVKKILELHGSAVQVTSTVGEGSRFWFSLPVAS